MHIKWIVPVLIVTATSIPACDRGTPAPTTAPGTPSAMDKAREDLKVAGHEIKQAATEAAAEARPALEKAKEEARDLTHRAAEKVSDMTVPTQPVPPPTQP